LYAGGALLFAIADLGRRWVLPPYLIIPAGLLWLVLFSFFAARCWRPALLFLATIPAGYLIALCIHVAVRLSLGLTPLD
jgi:hypothetical protein